MTRKEIDDINFQISRLRDRVYSLTVATKDQTEREKGLELSRSLDAACAAVDELAFVVEG